MSREETFHRLFPDLPESEVVIEDFRCALMQKYRCDRTHRAPPLCLAGDGCQSGMRMGAHVLPCCWRAQV